jgi:Zn-dependent protease
MWVALAGPGANFLLALVFALLMKFIPVSSLTPFLAVIVYANVLLAVFNLVPIPPLDGSKVLYALLPNSLQGVRRFLDQYGFILLFIFIIFLFKLIEPLIEGLYNFLLNL